METGAIGFRQGSGGHRPRAHQSGVVRRRSLRHWRRIFAGRSFLSNADVDDGACERLWSGLPAGSARLARKLHRSVRQAQRFTAWPFGLLSLSAAQAGRHLSPASLQAVAWRGLPAHPQHVAKPAGPRARGESRTCRADLYVERPAPKVHQSVMDRIRQGNDGYAPIVLPEKYYVVGNDGAITLNSGIEEPQAASRAIRQEKAWDWVWARRVTYFLTVFASLFLVAQPLVEKWRPGRGPASPAEVVVPIIDLAG